MTYHFNDIIHSDYWLPDRGYEDTDTLTLFKLAAAQRAISNFVNILTLKNIPVTFVSDKSITDGKSISIGGDIDKKSKFDIGVGLALHEASHILYSDFNSFKNLWSVIPVDIQKSAIGLTSHSLLDLCYTTYNYVEDRYIDARVCLSAKGYKGYYKRLYNEYFNNEDVTRELIGQNYRCSDLNSYMFRVINITNPSSDLSALKQLSKIYDILDLQNILRLSSPSDRQECAFDIVREILKDIKDEVQTNASYTQSYISSSIRPFPMLSENSNSSSVTNAENQYPMVLSGSINSDAFNINTDDYSMFTPDCKNDESSIFSILPNNNPAHEDTVSPLLEKQKDFINNHGHKKNLSQQDTKRLNIIADFNADIEETIYNEKSIDVIVIKNINCNSILSDEFPISNEHIKNVSCGYKQSVERGISIGNKIGNKLLVRNEVNIEKYSRRSNGKIDKKILHEIGFQNENIFYFTEYQRYKDLDIHISVDASSSMASAGSWEQTIVLTTALAKAISMLNNVTLSISFRTTMDKHPCLIMAYDSTKDNFVKIKNIFPYIHPNGLTPEGLTYKSLNKLISNKSVDSNKFFINICDGQPYFICGDIAYQGRSAAKHTQREVNKIKSAGYKIISYFVNSSGSEYIDESCRLNFKRMYGRNSHFIDICNMNQILTTIQNKLWEK